MRKEILKLLYDEMVYQSNLRNMIEDKNMYLHRIFIIRLLMETRRQINLYTPEEIFTAKNYFKLKRQMYIKKLKKLALAKADDEEDNKKKEPNFLEAFFIFLLLSQVDNCFFKLSEVITTIKLEDYYAKKTNKFTTKKN